MQSGYQTKGLSFWEHGELVAARYRDLMSSEPMMTWRLPDWFIQNLSWIKQELAPRFNSIQTYQLWHDCGKPYAREVDAEGKVHYPNHAQISEDIYRELGSDPEITALIRDDMLCHTIRTSDAVEFAKNPNALALLVTALCELHANASMFGGLISDSFKIKYKRLDKCGNIILNSING